MSSIAEYQRSHREFLSVAAFALVGAFVGINLADRPDNHSDAVWASILLLSMSFSFSELTKKRTNDISLANWFVIAVLVAMLWISSSALTAKPILMIGVISGWMLPIFFMAISQRPHEFDSRFDRMEDQIRNLQDFHEKQDAPTKKKK